MSEPTAVVTIRKPYYYLALVLFAVVIGIAFVAIRQNTRPPAAPPKPTLPLTVRSRPAILGSGLVVVITNNSPGIQIPVLVTISSPKTNATTARQVVINPKQSVEIGYAQGWAFSPGDKLKLSNNDYRDEEFVIH